MSNRLHSSLRKNLVIGVLLLTVMYPVRPVSAADPSVSEEPGAIPEVYAPDVLISATRTPTSIGNVNQSVTIVTEEQIQQQVAVSPGRSLSQILPKLVPGMSQNDGSLDSGTTQTIRGRQIAILID